MFKILKIKALTGLLGTLLNSKYAPLEDSKLITIIKNKLIEIIEKL